MVFVEPKTKVFLSVIYKEKKEQNTSRTTKEKSCSYEKWQILHFYFLQLRFFSIKVIFMWLDLVIKTGFVKYIVCFFSV